MEELIERREIYRGRIIQVNRDTVRLPDGGQTTREVIEHPGAAVIVPVDAAGNVVLIRQYRYAAGREMIELPAGTREKGELPDRTAPRELEEETGYTAGSWELLTRFFSSPGILTEEMFIYLARDLTAGASKTESDEKIQVFTMPLRQAVQMVERGEITDAKSIVGLLLAEKKLGTISTP
ncbi:MAG: NUDIX hydrolase [Anaerolineae bacterium]